MRSAALTVLLLAIIIAAGLRVWAFYAGRPTPGQPIERRMPLACAACGQAWIGRISSEPGVCRYCKSRSAWLALKCHEPDCGAIFPLVRDPAQRSDAPVVSCPRCGRHSASEVGPHELPEP